MDYRRSHAKSHDWRKRIRRKTRRNRPERLRWNWRFIRLASGTIIYFRGSKLDSPPKDLLTRYRITQIRFPSFCTFLGPYATSNNWQESLTLNWPPILKNLKCLRWGCPINISNWNDKIIKIATICQNLVKRKKMTKKVFYPQRKHFPNDPQRQTRPLPISGLGVPWMTLLNIFA